MKRATLVSSGSLNRILMAAQQAWQQKDFQRNLDLLQRASQLAPANIAILLQLGRMQGLRCDYVAAECSFDRAIRVSPRRTETMAQAGAHCRDFRNTELCERYLREAAEQVDVTPDVLADLAELYERQRRLPEAQQLIEQALRKNPDAPLARLCYARLERQAKRLDASEQLLRTFPTNANKLLRARAGYELGNVLDLQERYDEAMNAFLEAKAILKQDAKQFETGLQIAHARLQNLANNLTAEHFRRWQPVSAELEPPRRLALLGGHPRSGTTLLEQVLDSHPDIISAEETEIFHDEAYLLLTHKLPSEILMLPALEHASISDLKSARAAYFQTIELSLEERIGQRLLIDKNPSLTILIPALFRVFPEIKLLIALRDPRDVVMSCFMQPFYQLGQTNSAYLTLVGAHEEYAAVMNVWLACKRNLPNQWLEVRYEDMVEDLEAVARKSLDFLDVPWDAKVLGFDEHARKKLVRSPTYADVTQPVYKRAKGRWRNYQKYLEPHFEKLEPFVKAFGYD